MAIKKKIQKNKKTQDSAAGSVTAAPTSLASFSSSWSPQTSAAFNPQRPSRGLKGSSGTSAFGRKDALRMGPASIRRPRESRVLPHRPARAPATWEARGARICGRGPLRGLTEARAPSGRSPAHRHGPRAARYRKARPARRPTLGGRLLSLREAYLKDADPHRLHGFKNNDGSVSTSERPRASQTRLKMGALPAGLAGGWAWPRARSDGATLCACATAAASHNP